MWLLRVEWRARPTAWKRYLEICKFPHGYCFDAIFGKLLYVRFPKIITCFKYYIKRVLHRLSLFLMLTIETELTESAADIGVENVA